MELRVCYNKLGWCRGYSAIRMAQGRIDLKVVLDLILQQCWKRERTSSSSSTILLIHPCFKLPPGNHLASLMITGNARTFVVSSSSLESRRSIWHLLRVVESAELESYQRAWLGGRELRQRQVLMCFKSQLQAKVP